MWRQALDDARSVLPARASSSLLSAEEEDISPAALAALAIVERDDREDDVRLPPAIIDSEHGELASQTDYICYLEKLLSGRAMPEDGPAQARGAVALRQENRMLRAKHKMLQQQLDEAHARSRRAQQVNARWRQQFGELRRRERECWQALQEALKKAERGAEELRNNQRLRMALKQRTEELQQQCERCAELEGRVVSMGQGDAEPQTHTAGGRPPALDA
jgi:hypothetical protein